MIADNELGLTVHPFPINPQDILEVGGEMEPDFEELVHPGFTELHLNK